LLPVVPRNSWSSLPPNTAASCWPRRVDGCLAEFIWEAPWSAISVGTEPKNFPLFFQLYGLFCCAPEPVVLEEPGAWVGVAKSFFFFPPVRLFLSFSYPSARRLVRVERHRKVPESGVQVLFFSLTWPGRRKMVPLPVPFVVWLFFPHFAG